MLCFICVRIYYILARSCIFARGRIHVFCVVNTLIFHRRIFFRYVHLFCLVSFGFFFYFEKPPHKSFSIGLIVLNFFFSFFFWLALGANFHLIKVFCLVFRFVADWFVRIPILDCQMCCFVAFFLLNACELCFRGAISLLFTLV